jgi:C1A family cysteine protease
MPDGTPIAPLETYAGGPVHRGYFIVRNSWGAEWADAGYCYMPYNYFTPDLSADFWGFRK